jgi:excinuclease ABC subunit A
MATATDVLSIEIDQARTNNLKSLSCSIPQQQLTVVTGPSGSGKSSLVFDVLFAEGQRRYLESLSSYAKQFLDRIEKPDVESIRNILPAIALEQKNGVKNARSTVASVTNCTQLIGKLTEHLGQRTCTQCGSSHLSPINPLVLARHLLQQHPEKTKLMLTLSIPANHAETQALVTQVFQQGYFRFLTVPETGGIQSVQSAEAVLESVLPIHGQFELLIDRVVLKSTTEGEERLVQALEAVFKVLAQDAFLIAWTLWKQVPESATYTHTLFTSPYGCLDCGTSAQPLTDKQLNYLNPEGACPVCEGYGRAIGIEEGRIIPNPSLSLEEGAIHPFETPSHAELRHLLLTKAKRQGVAIDVPYHALSAEAKHWVWHGVAGVTAEDLWSHAEYPGISPFFEYLETKRYKMHVRVFLAKYRGYHTCTGCNGGRLKPAIQQVMLGSHSIEQWLNSPLQELESWLEAFTLPTDWVEALNHAFTALKQRITCLNAVGLGYLTLNRSIRTLSGGEAQRVNLSAMLGSELTETLYVLDEPTIGLHAKDTQQLMGVLQQLVGLGNTVVVVEHDATVMQQADCLLDIGPNSGEAGGELVFSGTYAELLKSHTLTAEFLNNPPTRASFFSETDSFFPPLEWITLTGATGNNLKNITLKFPKHQLVCVTGVSGAGKSSLVLETLFGNYQLAKGVIPSFEVLPCESLAGLESFADVVLIDQTPPARSMRSNPATVVKVFDDIRSLFAQTAKAQALGMTVGDFSFNSEGGRCETCQGLGFVTVDMQFMADVRLVCPDCDGKRYQTSVLSVELAGKTIADVLEMTINEVAMFFKAYPKIRRKLAPLQALGLGYVRLGQPTTTLSGGEAQRLKLATYLPEEGTTVKKPCLFLFDEPTVGLHLRDVAVLVKALRRMVLAGHSVVVIEHHLEFLQWAADWMIDIGPEAGERGGMVAYSGTYEAMARLPKSQSITADWLFNR